MLKRKLPRFPLPVLRAGIDAVSLESELCVVGFSPFYCSSCHSSWSGARRRPTARTRPVPQPRSTSATTSTSTSLVGRSSRSPAMHPIPLAPSTRTARAAISAVPLSCLP